MKSLRMVPGSISVEKSVPMVEVVSSTESFCVRKRFTRAIGTVLCVEQRSNFYHYLSQVQQYTMWNAPTAVTWFLIGLCCCRIQDVVAQDDFSLKILHLNDHHSHLAEETFSVATATLDPAITANINLTSVEEVDVTFGGFPRLVTLFSDLEAASTADALLKLHAGDVFSGTLFFTLYEGMADADLMTPICFHALTLGNHEFDLGNAVLEAFILKLEEETTNSCPEVTEILSANLVAPRKQVVVLTCPYSHA